MEMNVHEIPTHVCLIHRDTKEHDARSFTKMASISRLDRHFYFTGEIFTV